MRIAVVTDAWAPQLNGVVTVLVELRERLLAMGHEVEVVEPSAFRTFGCPGYPEIRLAWAAGDRVARRLDAWAGDAIHIATEGPLGLAARAYCRRRDLPFTTAVHSRFPEFLRAACGLPANIGYAFMRRFHAASSGVLVPSAGTVEILLRYGFENLRRWSHGIDLETFRPGPRLALGVPGPVFLCVGRIAAEKNLEAFLRLDLPGSKVVVGGGPLLERYRRAYPHARWMGPVPRQSLVAFYAAADVFVSSPISRRSRATTRRSHCLRSAVSPERAGRVIRARTHASRVIATSSRLPRFGASSSRRARCPILFPFPVRSCVRPLPRCSLPRSSSPAAEATTAALPHWPRSTPGRRS